MQFITSVIIAQSEQHIVQRKLEGLFQYKKLHGVTHNEEKLFTGIVASKVMVKLTSQN